MKEAIQKKKPLPLPKHHWSERQPLQVHTHLKHPHLSRRSKVRHLNLCYNKIYFEYVHYQYFTFIYLFYLNFDLNLWDQAVLLDIHLKKKALCLEFLFTNFLNNCLACELDHAPEIKRNLLWVCVYSTGSGKCIKSIIYKVSREKCHFVDGQSVLCIFFPQLNLPNHHQIKSLAS